MDCSYLSRKEWTYILVNFHKNHDDTGLIRVHAEGHLHELDIPADSADLITSETELRFYKDSHNYEAFELNNFNVLDFYPSDLDIAKLESARPDECDYMCSECNGKCFKCSNGNLLDDNTCPAGYIPIKQWSNLNENSQVNLREKISRRNYSTSRWGVSFFFYVKNVQEQTLHITSLYYDTFDGTFSKDNLLADITIDNKKLVFNGEVTFDHSDLENNKWYVASISVNNDQAHLNLKALDYSIDYKKDFTYNPESPKAYDDLEFIIGNSWETDKSERADGKAYDYRFWINNSPSDDDFETHFNSKQCPKNCVECKDDFTCAVCAEGYEVDTDGSCKDQELGKGEELVSKISIWSNDSSIVEIDSQGSNKLSFSIWLRKKRQSLGLGSHDLITAVNTNTKTTWPLLSETLQNDFNAEYTLKWDDGNEVKFSHSYADEIHDWMHVVIEADFSAKLLKYNVRNGENGEAHLKTHNWQSEFNAISLGDYLGKEINFEYAKVTLYRQLLTIENISTLRESPPQDCDPACLDCDYDSGICRSCDVDNVLVNTWNCNLYLKGFSNSNLFNKNSYDELTDSNQFSTTLHEVFTKDVNSLDYSIIGWFRLLDLDAFKQDGVYDIFSLNNYAQGSLTNRGADIIGIQVIVQNGTPGLYWVVNDDKPTTFEFDPQPKLDTNWILIHAGISVTEKTYTFAYWKDGNRSDASQKDLALFPQKLQETATLKLYSIGFDLPSNYKLGNGSFSDFYMIPNSGFNDKLLDIWLDKKPSEDPACPEGCAKCYNIAGNAMCVTCQDNFKLVNYACEPMGTGNYNILFTKCTHPQRFASVYMASKGFDSPVHTVTFWLRRNFVSDADISPIISTSSYTIWATTEGTNFKLLISFGKSTPTEFAILDTKFDEDYKWYGICIILGESYAKVDVTNVDKSFVNQYISGHKDIPLELSYEIELPTHLEIANLAVINKEVNYPVLPAPAELCDYYCDVCIMGVCKSCQYGSNEDGSCYDQPLFNVSRYSDGDNIDDKINIGDFTGTAKLLRSKKFTIIMKISVHTTDDSFRVFKLSNLDEDKETDFEVSNFLSLSFNAKELKWTLSVTNRYLGYNKLVNNIELFYAKPVVGSNHWIAISYDGVNHKINLFVQNTPENSSEGTYKFEGSSEHLTKFSNLFLNRISKATSFFGYKDVRVYPNQYIDVHPIYDILDADIAKGETCTEACMSECNKDNQCPQYDRVNEAFDLTDMKVRNFLENDPTVDEMYMFRKIRDFGKYGDRQWSINEYLLTYEFDLSHWSSSKYKINANELLVVGDFTADEYELKMADLIPEALFKYAHFVLQARGDVLRLIFNGDYQDLALPHDLSTYNSLFFSAYINAEQGWGKAFVHLDDNVYSLDWGKVSPAPFSLDTMVYTHPSADQVLVNVHKPRFDVILEKYFESDSWTASNYRTNTCNAVTEGCEKCLTNLKENSNGCWKCDDLSILTCMGTCYPKQN